MTELDGIDRKLLNLLEQDARLTYAQLGEEVSLAPSSVHDRVRKLEKGGVIKGYRAEIDLSLADLPIVAFVSLGLRPTSPNNIPSRVAEFPLVESCYSVAGEHSYNLVVRAPSTTALEELLDGLRSKLEVVTRATIVLSTPFERRPMVAAGGPAEEIAGA